VSDWLDALAERLAQGVDAVRVTVAATRGSAPREAGACMLVDTDGVEGTIGGGNLEWEAIHQARRVLAPSAPAIRYRRLTLGTGMSQCCGGVAELWWERVPTGALHVVRAAQDRCQRGETIVWTSTPNGPAVVAQDTVVAVDEASRAMARGLTEPADERSDTPRLWQQHGGPYLTQLLGVDTRTPLWLFGAGHVGRAVATTLAELPFAVTWVDDRCDAFPDPLPGDAAPLLARAPEEAARRAPNGAWGLVMTHSHALDEAICRVLLSRPQPTYTGLIGSHSKAIRFARRLADAGVPPAHLERLICPVGIAGVEDKTPSAIAIGITAQLLQQRDAKRADRPGVTSGLAHKLRERRA